MTETKTVEVTQADVVLPRAVFDFLMGTADYDGVSFGDLNDGLPGRFWWRALLTAAERATAGRLASRSLSTDEEVRRLREALELSVAFIEETHPAQVAIIKRAREALQSKDTPSHGG